MKKTDVHYYIAACLTHSPFISKHFSDEAYIKTVYRGYQGKKLNLANPQSFNEKIQWLKLHDHNPGYSKMVDKIEAKEYVKSVIGDQYIIPTLGVWERYEDIDFSNLPNQFVLKCSHDSGGLVICRDKNRLDSGKAKKVINKSLKRNYYWYGREWPYKNVKPRILAEKYMEDNNSFINNRIVGLVDYKFFCFNGVPQLLYVSRGLENHYTAEISFYNMKGIEMPFHRKDYKPYHGAVMPSNFVEMSLLAEKLAANINCPFVRIDLYSINGHIYFSEITFSPCGGMIPFDPETADIELGKELILNL